MILSFNSLIFVQFAVKTVKIAGQIRSDKSWFFNIFCFLLCVYLSKICTLSCLYESGPEPEFTLCIINSMVCPEGFGSVQDHSSLADDRPYSSIGVN